ncbi:MAG TPA: hypothetical protein VG755_25035 [Nannocystaceae bacterium]|nr:hypothetical protein [Nannocystaceae bacterium]
MSEVAAHQIRCPACAAPVEAPPGDVLRCKYCGVESQLGRAATKHAARVPDSTSSGLPIVTIFIIVIALGGAVYWLLLAPGGVDAPAVQPPTVTAVSTPVVAPTPEPIPVVEPAPEVEPPFERPEMPDMFSAKPSEGSIAVRWRAKVKKASGRSKRGVACEIDGWVEDNGDSIRPLDVRCKGDLLYSSTQKFSGSANMSTGATVTTAKDGSPRWLLRYNDTGSRSDRPQIRLDSAARIGRVWSDELPPWDVELTIEPDGAPQQPSG